jgi:hypothetical protein
MTIRERLERWFSKSIRKAYSFVTLDVSGEEWLANSRIAHKDPLAAMLAIHKADATTKTVKYRDLLKAWRDEKARTLSASARETLTYEVRPAAQIISQVIA